MNLFGESEKVSFTMTCVICVRAKVVSRNERLGSEEGRKR